MVLLAKVALIISTRSYESDYLAESRVKQARLHASGQNRVILIGGSNLAFGIDSGVLEKSLGRPAANMGLHAALGLEYMLEEAAHGARPGDLAVLIPEYEHFYGTTAGDGTTLLSLLRFNPSAARYLTDYRQWLNIARATAIVNNRQWLHTMFIRIAERSSESELYSARGFNAEGDFVAHLGLPSPPGVVANKLGGSINPNTVGLIARFCSKMTAEGVGCVVVYPAISRVIGRSTGIRSAVSPLKLRSRRSSPSPRIGFTRMRRFFDTSYHLKAEARQLRTEQLARALTLFLQEDARRDQGRD